ncbi:TorD/DmsD family molecular chaperone [Paenibacillus crassostreae]|uniref:Dehydrogenase n=1 Tax=Paenibacillus crassostreae TaxID=1763538 RepID=A0A167B4B9_9BACL|nr:molecular chaperone TorD family protein [Paenibacillus crassostreae]AOZ93181.1 hypothetical protein LPB68_13815 [Paenibacillus crassostreae]OAB71728.1 hypothetical protein PNBC_17075 [Paenibacillus crassostreae]
MNMTMELSKDSEECTLWKKRRGWMYQLLIDFLGNSPSLSLISQWRQHMVTREDVLLTEGGQRLIHYFSNIHPSQLIEISEVEKKEYRRLFEGTQPLFPSLCESSYISKVREKQVDCTADIREVYVRSGIAFNKLSHEHDDYILIELEYMAILAERTSDHRRIRIAQLSLIDDQIKFLEDHVMNWVPIFGEDLMNETHSPIYTEIGSILRDFITYDRRMLHTWRENLS